MHTNKDLDRIHNSYHTESWEQMSAIKSRILQIWDGAPTPVKLSCIKFAQRVVLAQTVSNGMEQKVGGLPMVWMVDVANTQDVVRWTRHLLEHNPPESPTPGPQATRSRGNRPTG